jgi:hypothetical protein
MSEELNVLLEDWRWLLDPGDYRLLAISPFGDLLLQDKTGTISLLGALVAAAVQGTDPAVLFPIAFDSRIAAGYRANGLVLTDGECYGYKYPCVAGGSMELENVYVAKIAEYISFMGDFHHDIQDVADGETVTIKVINQKVVH